MSNMVNMSADLAADDREYKCQIYHYKCNCRYKMVDINDYFTLS